MNKIMLKAQSEVKQILKRLAEREPNWDGHLNIRLMGQGDQARLFLVQRADARSGQGLSEEVVVKLYKHFTAEDRQAFVSEKRSLEILQTALPVSSGGAWTLRSPRLFFACEETLALVMSVLPGVPLDRWLQSNQNPDSAYASVAQAVRSALECLWSRDVMYGDLNLKNILCEPTRMTVGFLDPGLPNALFHCHQVPRDFYPASRDMAYLLYSVAVSVKSTLLKPRARNRQLSFVKELLRQHIDSIETNLRRTQLLEEIRLCAQVHVQGIQCSWSATGIWRRKVKQITQRSLDHVLTDLSRAACEVNI